GEADEQVGVGAQQVARVERVPDRHEERDLRDDDREEQGGQQRAPASPALGTAQGAPVARGPQLLCATGAGGLGGERGHQEPPAVVDAASDPAWYVSATVSAKDWAWSSASSTVCCPAIAADIC